MTMSLDPTADDRERLEQIIAAWEQYDRTFDVSDIAEYLADDIILMVPETPPITGKEAVLDYLDRPEEEAHPTTEQWAENIYVSGNLAVISVRATFGDQGNGLEAGGIKGLDVCRRDVEGWRQLISIYNEHV